MKSYFLRSSSGHPIWNLLGNSQEDSQEKVWKASRTRYIFGHKISVALFVRLASGVFLMSIWVSHSISGCKLDLLMSFVLFVSGVFHYASDFKFALNTAAVWGILEIRLFRITKKDIMNIFCSNCHYHCHCLLVCVANCWEQSHGLQINVTDCWAMPFVNDLGLGKLVVAQASSWRV